MASPRIRLLVPFITSVFIASLSADLTVYRSDYSGGVGHMLPSMACSVNGCDTFYGIMFDAGSTGTRIHIYTFIQNTPAEPPHLDREIFESVKPGLSAYVDQPEQGAETVRELLEVAKQTVPPSQWEKTPVVLKATAGLRLLPEKKAQALLSEVKEIFDESPFLVPDNSVSIMNGTYEGILAWITINFLTGRLYSTHRRPVGTLDLGGASTQITFLPESQKTFADAPESYFSSFEMFNRTYKLYTHSYLSFGLKAARLAILGALQRHEKGHTYTSSCLPKDTKAAWMFGGNTYRYGGNEKGETDFQSCYSEVLKVVRGSLHQPEEIASNTFYAFSYYYDRAVDAGLIDNERGGVIEVKDFERKAKEVCNDLPSYNRASPFLCMDLSYITALLKEGFGFHEDTVLRLAKKVNNVETSWALGAAFHLLQTLSSRH